MGLVLGSDVLLALVAAGTGKIMGTVEFMGVAITTTVWRRFLSLGNWCRACFFICLILGAATGKKENECGSAEESF
jgi:hypothetical protein